MGVWLDRGVTDGLDVVAVDVRALDRDVVNHEPIVPPRADRWCALAGAHWPDKGVGPGKYESPGPTVDRRHEVRQSHGGPLALSARFTRRFQQASPLVKNLDLHPIPPPFPEGVRDFYAMFSPPASGLAQRIWPSRRVGRDTPMQSRSGQIPLGTNNVPHDSPPDNEQAPDKGAGPGEYESPGPAVDHRR